MYYKQGNTESHTRSIRTRFALCKLIRNPGNFGEWNPESTALESGIRKSKIQPLKGIRNPWMWNPESTDVETGIQSVESGIQDSLRLPFMGRLVTVFSFYHGESETIYQTQGRVFHQITN